MVLSWARQLLNSTFEAGGSYGGIFVRDTATFVDVALDVKDSSTVGPLLLKILSFQHPNGDLGVEGVTPSKTGGGQPSPMLKSDAATDQESSFVQMIYKYVQHSGDTKILNQVVVSSNDPTPRPLVRRMEMMLEFLSNTSARTSPANGLLWGAVMVDWGDVQNCQGPEGCNQQLDNRTTVAHNAYINAMFSIAMQNFADLVQPTTPAKAQLWRTRDRALAAAIKNVLWDDNKAKFRPQPHACIPQPHALWAITRVSILRVLPAAWLPLHSHQQL